MTPFGFVKLLITNLLKINTSNKPIFNVIRINNFASFGHRHLKPLVNNSINQPLTMTVRGFMKLLITNLLKINTSINRYLI